MTNFTKLKILKIYTDGGARGNPGPAATGVVIKHGGEVVYEGGRYIGKTTNNVAEYSALIDALEWVKERGRGVELIDCYLDSRLVVQQLKGVFKIKKSHLRKLVLTVKALEQDIMVPVQYHHIRREENHEADAQVNKALDEFLS